MITRYIPGPDGLKPVQPGQPGAKGTLWIDAESPDARDLAALSGELGMDLPSKADQEEIEQSSRLYLDDGVPVMTALLPSSADTGEMRVEPVSFLLRPDMLVTIRHHAPSPFSSFPAKAARASLGCNSAEAVMLGLVEEIIDRLADITEQTGREIEAVSRLVFGQRNLTTEESRRALRQVGMADTTVMQLRESLMTMDRLLGFLTSALETRKMTKGVRAMLKSQYRDARTISEHAGYLQQKTALLLDATLGQINIEQNAIIKIFSVVAVAFLPPTLVASIYGMNFHDMPELGWHWGYPMALGLMILSAALPLWFFRRRGWL